MRQAYDYWQDQPGNYRQERRSRRALWQIADKTVNTRERLSVLPYSSTNRYVFNIEAQRSQHKRERLCVALCALSVCPSSGNSNREQGLRLGAVSTRSLHRRGTIDLNHAKKENLNDLSPLNKFWQAHTTHNANRRGRTILPLRLSSRLKNTTPTHQEPSAEKALSNVSTATTERF